MRLPVVELRPPAPVLETGPRSIAAVDVLRISVTDRCNFRCVYCMPADGVAWLPRENILNYEEIADVVRAALEIHGIRRFKLTGGEPTVRANLLDLVSMLRKIPGIEDLSMTTNGFVLEHLAQPLKEAGLTRVTVSIDSLNPDRFREITRTGNLAAVLRGLDRCDDIGLPTKINCVAMRGVNDDEFSDFARLTLSRNLTVRFIEYMPLGDAAIMNKDERIESLNHRSIESLEKQKNDSMIQCSDDSISSSFILHPSSLISAGPAEGCGSQIRSENAFVSEFQIRSAIENSLGTLIPIDRSCESGVGPAIPYRLAFGNPKGRIGFISAMSQPFCSTCNRLRLTADGVLRSCLFEGGEVDIRSILRNETNSPRRRELLANAMTDCVRLKPDIHSGHGNRQMSQIGG